MSDYTWTQQGQRWTLDAAPRYAVRSREHGGGYAMLIDGYEVDTADALSTARRRLECTFEYEEHGAELEMARHRLSQARERLAARFPRAAQDPQLASILEGLADALGNGPEAGEPEEIADCGDRWRQSLSPELAVVLDASQCIVLEISGNGRVLRRPVVTDVDELTAALDTMRRAQHRVLADAEVERARGIDERRRAEGRLTRVETARLLVDEHHVPRHQAVSVTAGARSLYQAWAERFPAEAKTSYPDMPVRAYAGEAVFLVTFDGEYWAVRPSPDNP